MTNQLPITPQDVGLTCDLSHGNAFVPERNAPPIPVLTNFGDGNLHQCRVGGSWDFDRAVAENRSGLIRSFRRLFRKTGTDIWEDVIFQFGERRFLCGEKSRIIGYGETAEDADAAIMTRGKDNQDQVSALLNLSDGMLGDFLSLQIICTINCAAAEIDQALLRPVTAFIRLPTLHRDAWFA